MIKYLIAFLVIAVLGGLFILVYYLNSRIKAPDNCEELPEECARCKVTICKRNPSREKKED